MNFLKKNRDITVLSNFRTPAYAKYFFELQNIHDIDKIYEIHVWARKNNLPILIVSGGTNMLFAFDIYEGIVILNKLKGWEYNKDSKFLKAYGAEPIWDIAESLEQNYEQNLWHRFIGLPGSVAGAVYGNAGCFGLETQNNFVSCEVLDLETGHMSIIVKKDMKFGYRSSLLKQEKNFFLISAKFDLSQKIEKYQSDVDNIDFRKNKQPKGNSCGSFFKNPKREHSAGYLIESVGLKGYRYGGAYISEKHANFLMHDGLGTWTDLMNLIYLVQTRVKDQFGIDLENEVQIISNPQNNG